MAGQEVTGLHTQHADSIEYPQIMIARGSSGRPSRGVYQNAELGGGSTPSGYSAVYEEVCSPRLDVLTTGPGSKAQYDSLWAVSTETRRAVQLVRTFQARSEMNVIERYRAWPSRKILIAAFAVVLLAALRFYICDLLASAAGRRVAYHRGWRSVRSTALTRIHGISPVVQRGGLSGAEQSAITSLALVQASFFQLRPALSIDRRRYQPGSPRHGMAAYLRATSKDRMIWATQTATESSMPATNRLLDMARRLIRITPGPATETADIAYPWPPPGSIGVSQRRQQSACVPNVCHPAIPTLRHDHRVDVSNHFGSFASCANWSVSKSSTPTS